MADELWRFGATELAALIRDGSVSARDVIEAHLARIDDVDEHVNAVVRVLGDEALLAADAADAALAAGAPVGPLHGVPFTVKENIDVAGTPTTGGMPANSDAVATADNPLVERMRGAGAIPIGRTNLPDMALRVTTDSSLHGATRNPWAPGLTAGGSSGGEAVALATGMSPLGFGNDLGGSVRSPAHCCGVASIRPTAGVIATAGSRPPEDLPLILQLFAVQGVMARHPVDVRLGLTTVAGQHPRDPLSVPAHLTDVAPGTPARIAVLTEVPTGETDPGIAAVVRHAADVLADLGHEVVEASPPSMERALELYGQLVLADIRIIRPMLDAVLGEPARRFLDFMDAIVPGDLDRPGWLMAMMERSALGRKWSLWFDEHDVLVCPVWTQPAFAEGADVADETGARAVFDRLQTLVPANLLGLPAAVVPGGMADGLPVGVQVMGGRFTDLRCLAIAEQVEQVVGPLTPIDPVNA